MGYKVKQLDIENFKSITKCSIDLENKDLVVLDGPNGFGKTTIFDAIEFVLTGEVRRIKENKITNGKKGYSDFLFAKNQNEETQVRIQLYDSANEKSLILAREVKPSTLTKLEKRPGEFKSTLYKLNKMDESLSPENKIDFIDEVLNFKDFYGLYNYIEQEESTHFLKNSESDRVSLISKLFNIEKETIERHKIYKAKNILQKNISLKRNEINSLSKEIDNRNIEQKLEPVEYIQLLPNAISQIEMWDHLNPIIENLNDKNKYFSRIDILSYLNTNFDKFKDVILNKSIQAIVNKKDRIQAVLVLSYIKNKIPEIQKEYTLRQQLEKTLQFLLSKDVLNPQLDWHILKSNFKLIDIDSDLSNLRGLNKDSSELNILLKNILDSRQTLIKHFENFHKKVENTSPECPLCGHNWEDYQKMIQSIQLQAEYLRSKLDDSGKKTDYIITNLYENALNNLIIEIKDRLDRMISKDAFSIIDKLNSLNINFEGVVQFFASIDVDITEYIYTTTTNYDDLELRVNSLSQKILEKMVVIQDFNYELLEELEDIYNNIFKRNDDLLKNSLLSLTIDNINKKKSYLTNVWILKGNEKNKKLNALRNHLSKKEQLFETLDRALKIYDSNIEKYRREMVREIEIPFYIYTGKIIQNYQRGIGVFLREDNSNEEGIKALRFVPQTDTDHDIIHTFSSGQLAGTILAFTLSLNKVFDNSMLNTLLIDDPMQTMDEINMASFVELLRNEFSNQQIILSTHDSQISLYARYKYSKYGYDTLNINVKTALYNDK